MKNEQDYTRDITEIRSMMERSSKFLSLSGWAGIMAGIYALIAAYIVYVFFGFHPVEIYYKDTEISNPDLLQIIVLTIALLILSIGTAFFLSYKRAQKHAEKVWNATSRRLINAMSVPLVTGGILILIFINQGLIGLIAPMTLLFYGLALYSAGNYTYKEVKFLGVTEVALGLISSFYIEYSLLLWAIGFGLVHIVYGVYIHVKHER